MRSPESIERNRKTSREAKRRRTGTCRECGAVTRYNGSNGQTVSALCGPCSSRAAGERSRGRGKTQARILEVLAGVETIRYVELRDRAGVTPEQMGQLVGRLLRNGQIERVSRGVYRLAETSS